MTPGTVVSRVSTNARFSIEYSGTTEQVPRDLCVKGYFNELGRAARFIGEAETYFYRDLAGAIGIRTLNNVYADVDPVTRHGVVITEDLVTAGGEFLDARTHYTPSQAATILRDMAKLHASTWNNPRWADTPWLRARIGKTLSYWGEEAVLSRIGANMSGPNGRRVPAAARNPKLIFDAYTRLVAETVSAVNDGTTSWCVIHGDGHPGNLILDADGRPALVDWQLVQRGIWYFDVAYHIASTLSVEDRRRSERELLAQYLADLAEFGAEAPDFDEAWRQYGRGIVHGLYLWGITAEVEPQLIEILVHRLGTAAADHDALTGILGGA
ncbi:phosphotransferase [Rhodococcus sp. P1Y]|uniref:phosphotransferase n=1 Tax=Rhodococcus sp. P1Y TaxID=1302308 RepID=UPI002E2751A3